MCNEYISKQNLKLSNRWEILPESFLSELAQKISDFENNIIDLSIGDPDIRTHQNIIKYAFERTHTGHMGYTEPDGAKEFISGIQRYYREKYSLNLESDQIRATVGAMHGMYMALMAIINAGDEVIIFEPYYPPYVQQVYMCDGIPIYFDSLHNKNSREFLDKLENLISSKTKVIIVNSPNNPSGIVYSDKILDGIAKLAIRYNLYIFSDEVYEIFTFLKDYISIYNYAPNHTIIFGSFSKSFRMTGWRIGYMIASKEINDVVRVISDSLTYTPPTISQYAAVYALNNQWIATEYANLINKRLKYIHRRVKRMNCLSMEEVQGGIFAFICVKNTGLTSREFSKILFERYHVLVAPGNLFSKTFGQYYIRISVTQKLAVLIEALDRIETFLLEL